MRTGKRDELPREIGALMEVTVFLPFNFLLAWYMWYLASLTRRDKAGEDGLPL